MTKKLPTPNYWLHQDIRWLDLILLTARVFILQGILQRGEIFRPADCTRRIIFFDRRLQRSADLSTTRRSVLISGYLGIGGGQGEGWGLVVRGRGRGGVGGEGEGEGWRDSLEPIKSGMVHYGTCNTINCDEFLECCPMQLPSPAFCVVLSQAANSKLSAAEIYMSIYVPIPFEAAHAYFVYSWLWVFSPSFSVSSPFLYVLPHPWTIYRITGDKTVNGSLFTCLSRDYSPSLWPWLYPAPGHAKRRNPRWSDHGVFKQQHSSLCPSPRQRFVDRD